MQRAFPRGLNRSRLAFKYDLWRLPLKGAQNRRPACTLHRPCMLDLRTITIGGMMPRDTLLSKLKLFVGRFALLNESVVLIADCQPDFEARSFTRLAYHEDLAFVTSNNSM